MGEDFDKVIALANHFGLNPNVDLYNWRFIIQKLTFLAQVLGIDTSYVFTPYAAGPYATTLASDYYNHREQLSSGRTDYQLNQTEIQSVQRINEYTNLEGNMARLESASTFVYIIHKNPSLDDNEINRVFRNYKPYITKKDRILGLNQAKQLLFKEEYLTEEIKEEMDLWDGIE